MPLVMVSFLAKISIFCLNRMQCFPLNEETTCREYQITQRKSIQTNIYTHIRKCGYSFPLPLSLIYLFYVASSCRFLLQISMFAGKMYFHSHMISQYCVESAEYWNAWNTSVLGSVTYQPMRSNDVQISASIFLFDE